MINNIYELSQSYQNEKVCIKVNLSKEQLSEAVAFIALVFDDIVSDKQCGPKTISKFLSKYFDCKVVQCSKIDKDNKLKQIDIFTEKIKRVPYAYYFKSEYSKKHSLEHIKEDIFSCICDSFCLKRYNN